MPEAFFFILEAILKFDSKFNPILVSNSNDC